MSFKNSNILLLHFSAEIKHLKIFNLFCFIIKKLWVLSHWVDVLFLIWSGTSVALGYKYKSETLITKYSTQNGGSSLRFIRNNSFLFACKMQSCTVHFRNNEKCFLYSFVRENLHNIIHDYIQCVPFSISIFFHKIKSYVVCLFYEKLFLVTLIFI